MKMNGEMNLELIHCELLSMMKDIHRLCKENGIDYSLTGGSLLGAIRENGFIPWDDDIDIMVNRSNYIKLCEALTTSDKYEMGRGPWLQHIKPTTFDSDIDPYIDVFIMDNLPDNHLSAMMKILVLKVIQGMLKEKIDYQGFSFPYKVCIFITHMLGMPFSRVTKLKLYDAVSGIGNKSATKYLTITNDSFGLLNIKHNAEVMEDFEEWRFEDTTLMVTKKSQDYLTARYGPTYMTPPPERERIQFQHINRPKVKDEKAGV